MPLFRLKAVLKVLLSFNSNFFTYLALICWPSNAPREACNTFDGTIAAETYSSNYYHYYGFLGMYKSQPTTVGSAAGPGSKKVETLGENGWEELEDFPL